MFFVVGAMSFDEEELRALSQNIGAATANFAMEASERSKRTLSPKRRKPDATVVTEENGEEEGGQDEEEKLKRVALIKQRQALFDNLERSEEISKDEIKEGEKMMKELQARVDKKRAEKSSPQQTGKTEKKAQKTDSRTAVAKKTGTPKPPPRRKRSSSLRDLRPKRSISQREHVPPKRQSSLTDLTSKSKEATTSNAESSCEMPSTTPEPVTSQTSQKTSSSGSEKSTSSSMKSPVETVTSSHEISARRASSVPARSPVRPKQPPKCHYKVVYVRISLVGKTIDASITENLVLIFIPLGSPLFYHFVVGDQILDIDGLVPKNLAEFLELVDSATGEITLAVVRAWNVRPPTPKRMSHVWTVKKRSYLIVELPLLENMRAGFEFICHNNRLYFSKLDPQTMGAFAFLTVDRIVDVDSIQRETVSVRSSSKDPHHCIISVIRVVWQ
ncbi:unnamed protein product [Nippostrongylus brasiliensis]|uniref:PDZ domain-containing protein n=1 Tax=Nippostrongylus brasiliensis TaxID=27835 RepID=A0A158R358_NIPBR|nr:unnamed protein product [Nippostrongylus brasiliensis]